MNKRFVVGMTVLMVGSACLLYLGSLLYPMDGSIAADRQVESTRVDTPVAAGTNEQHGTSGSDTNRDRLHAMLNDGASIDQALAATAGPDDVLTDARMVSLVDLASSVCTSEPDPLGALSDGAPVDPTRTWAIARVLELCDGFDASRYRMRHAGFDPAKVRRESGPEVAASEAMKAVRTGQGYFDVVSGGQALLEYGSLPLDRILPGASTDYGLADLVPAMAHAATLLTCKEAGGCGPNSLEVASFCANVGCRPGSDISQAFREELSAKDNRAVWAFYAWLSSQRDH